MVNAKVCKNGRPKIGTDLCCAETTGRNQCFVFFVQKTLFLSLSRFFSPHDLNGSRIKKASLKFFIFVVVVVVVAIFSAGCT